MDSPLRRRRSCPFTYPAFVQKDGRRNKVAFCAHACVGLLLATAPPTTHAFRPPVSLHGAHPAAPRVLASWTTTPRTGGGPRAAIGTGLTPATIHGTHRPCTQQPSSVRKEVACEMFSTVDGREQSALRGRQRGPRAAGGARESFGGASLATVGPDVGGSSRRSRRQSGARQMSMAEGEGGGGESNSALVSAIAVAGLAFFLFGMQHSDGSVSLSLESLLETAKDGPSALGTALQTFLNNTFSKVEDMGSLGPLYFGAVYVLAEVFIIPALPFTAAAGYLFGVAGGTAIVLTSATIAAGFSFLLGRTFLRRQVEGLLQENPKFLAIDKAIGKEGFKIILLLRLSPIFPFALSNYFYGVTAVNFVDYMAGTMLGFLPGTLAYVYGGTVGKALTEGGEGMALPWYGYAAGAVLVGFLLKTVGDIATNAVEELEPGLKDDN